MIRTRAEWLVVVQAQFRFVSLIFFYLSVSQWTSTWALWRLCVFKWFDFVMIVIKLYPYQIELLFKDLCTWNNFTYQNEVLLVGVFGHRLGGGSNLQSKSIKWGIGTHFLKKIKFYFFIFFRRMVKWTWRVATTNDRSSVLQGFTYNKGAGYERPPTLDLYPWFSP